MMKRFLDELRRRRVPQVVGFYAAAAWIAFEVADATFPRLGLPDWTVTFVLALLLLGFPLVTGLAWVFDITREGVRRTAPATTGEGVESGAGVRGASGNFLPIAVIGAVAVLALAGIAYVLFGNREPPAEMARDALVVLPFTVRGGDDAAVLAEGMVELLSAKLDGAGQLRSVDAHTVLSRAHAGLDPAAAQDLARRLGGGYYVLGSVLEFGGGLRIQASIYETDGGREPVAEQSVEGPADSFLGLVDDLATELLVAGKLAPPGRMPRIAAMTTEDLSALKFFLEGERAFRDARYEDAIDRFERAVEVDSTFALAFYRMAVAASWAERRGLVQRAIDTAYRHRDRLSERDRALIAAFDARQDGRNAESVQRYRAILASYPADIEAWYELGEVVLHDGALLGIPGSEIGEPFVRTVELDPGNVSALHHLTNAAVWVRDTTALDSLTRAIRNQPGAEMPQSLEAQWTFARGDSAARARLLVDLVASGSSTGIIYAAWATEDARDVRELLAAALDVPYTSFDWIIPNMLATFGVRDEALDWLEERESALPGPPVRTALLASQPLLRTSPARLERLRTQMLEWDPGPIRTEPVDATEWGSLEPVHPHLRLYLLALLDGRLGRPDEALRRAGELEALGGAAEVRLLAADLARHVRAQVEFDRGRAAEALRIIEGASFWETSPWDERASALYSFAGPISLRAEALLALGRSAEAIQWYSTFALGPWAFGFSAYRQGQAWEALEQPDRAAERYAAFVRRWAGADPGLQEFVADARRRLEALSGEG